MVLDEVRKTHEEMLSRMEGMQVSRSRTINDLNNNPNFFLLMIMVTMITIKI